MKNVFCSFFEAMTAYFLFFFQKSLIKSYLYENLVYL